MAHFITITWTASADVVDGYNIYRGLTPGSEAPPALNGSTLVTATTYTDTTVEPGQSYSYVVKSVVKGLESVASNEITSTVLLPLPPTNLEITAAV